MSDAVIQNGSRVRLHFSLRLKDNGRLVESTESDEPMTLVLGRGELVEGLERCLLGLHAGDRQRFEIPYQQAYGAPSEDNLHTLALSEFDAPEALKAGMVMGFSTPDGVEIPGVIREIQGESVVVDFSHPLAGHDLIFEVEIVAVVASSPNHDMVS